MKKIRYGLFKLLAILGKNYGQWKRLKIPIYPKTWKYLFKEIFIDEIYNFKSSANQPFIVDCGANIGYSILYFKSIFPNSKILAFEASLETYEKLLRTLECNTLEDVKIERIALTNQQDTKLKFFKNSAESCDLGASLIFKNEGSYEEVEAKKLSSYLTSYVDFLKVDIEGSETDIFKDLVESKKLYLIRQGLIEFHLNDSNPNNSLPYILNVLTANGFAYRFIEIDQMEELWPQQQAILIRFTQV